MGEERYVIKCNLGFFKPGNSGSLFYNETDFVESVYDAYWYKDKGYAVKKALVLKRSNDSSFHGNDGSVDFHDVNIFKVNVKVDMSNGKLDLEEERKNTKLYKKIVKLTEFVKHVKSLSRDETNALSEKEWNEYLEAKRFVRDNVI